MGSNRVAERALSQAKMGRPTKYDPKFVAVAEQMCKMGATESDLAAAFQVTVATVRYWTNAHVDFLEALKHGKEASDRLIERSLAHRALGYTYDSEEVKVIDDVVVRVPVKKHVPPDVTACIFWLKNRKPDEWRDVNRFEHPGQDGISMEVGHDVRIEIERRVISIAARLRTEEGTRQLIG